jgi:hypothetical protein
MNAPQRRTKQPGSPFAKPTIKPWAVNDDSGAALAITALVFFRRGFGDRFLAPSDLSAGAALLAIYALLLRFLAGGGHLSISQPVSWGTWLTWLIFFICFLVCGSFHVIAAARRPDRRKDEFSQSDGQPQAFLMKIAPFVHDEWDFEMFFEPLVCIAAGALLLWFRNWFGIYLIVCGYLIHSRTKARYQLARQSGLGVMDGLYTSERLPDFAKDDLKSAPTPIKSHDATPAKTGEGP